jgi:hypothetical protein
MGPSKTLVDLCIELSNVDDRFLQLKSQHSGRSHFLIGSPKWNPFNRKMIVSCAEEFSWYIAGLVEDLTEERDWALAIYPHPEAGRRCWWVVFKDFKTGLTIHSRKYYGCKTSCMLQGYIEVAKAHKNTSVEVNLTPV